MAALVAQSAAQPVVAAAQNNEPGAARPAVASAAHNSEPGASASSSSINEPGSFDGPGSRGGRKHRARKTKRHSKKGTHGKSKRRSNGRTKRRSKKY